MLAANNFIEFIHVYNYTQFKFGAGTKKSLWRKTFSLSFRMEVLVYIEGMKSLH